MSIDFDPVSTEKSTAPLQGQGAVCGDLPGENVIDLSDAPECVGEGTLQVIQCDLSQIASLRDIKIDLAIHEALKNKLHVALVEFEQIYKTPHHSWAKKFFLSPEQRDGLKQDIDQAGRLIHALSRVCDDTLFIHTHIEEIKKAAQPTQSKDGEIRTSSENFVSIRIKAHQCGIEALWHLQNLKFLEERLKQYNADIQHFLSLPENHPPKQNAVDRLSAMIAPLPSLIGAALTSMFYLLGTTATLAFIPLGVGMLGSAIAIAIYTKDFIKAIPTEKAKQLTEERKELIESFSPILDLLRKVIDMFETRPTSPSSSGVDNQTFNTTMNKASETIDKRFQELNNKFDKFVNMAAPILQDYSRARKNSSHSDKSSDSDSSQTTYDSGIGSSTASSRSTSPAVGKASNLTPAEWQELKDKEKQTFKELIENLRSSLAGIGNTEKSIDQVLSLLISEAIKSDKLYSEILEAIASKLAISREMERFLFYKGEPCCVAARKLQSRYAEVGKAAKIEQKLCNYAQIDDVERKLASA